MSFSTGTGCTVTPRKVHLATAGRSTRVAVASLVVVDLGVGDPGVIALSIQINERLTMGTGGSSTSSRIFADHH